MTPPGGALALRLRARWPRWGAAWLLLLAAVLPAACRRGQAPAGPAVERVLLVVSNRGYFDVNVYAVPASGVAGRRLGTVTGNSSATIFVSGSDLQPGNQLMLFVRAIGGRTGWTSPLVNVGFGVAARLDVYATNSGDLYQSQLYTVTSAPPPPDTLVDTLRQRESRSVPLGPRVRIRSLNRRQAVRPLAK